MLREELKSSLFCWSRFSCFIRWISSSSFILQIQYYSQYSTGGRLFPLGSFPQFSVHLVTPLTTCLRYSIKNNFVDEGSNGSRYTNSYILLSEVFKNIYIINFVLFNSHFYDRPLLTYLYCISVSVDVNAIVFLLLPFLQ